jgi:putative ABC transport system permease protein
LLPADFQADYARDMESTFRAQRRDAERKGRTSIVLLWSATLGDLLRTAPREHAAQLADDTRYALRILRAAPGFTAVAVLTLAVGIGANTALFSVVHALLLRPLPFPDPARIVRIFESRPQDGLFRNSVSGPNLLDWKEQSRAFSAIAAYRPRNVNVSGRGEPRYVQAARASVEFFHALGVRPALGRLLTLEEERDGGPVAVISHRLWQSQFSGAPNVLGQTLTLDGEPFVVIGVLPADFRFQLDADVWIRLGLYPGNMPSRGSHNLNVIARLKDGATLEAARAELATIAARLERQYPESNTGWTVVIEPLLDSTVSNVRPIALLLFGAVGFLLLTACANIGSLLVARAARRTREFAVRIALGANRTRLIRQLLTESVLLAAVGGAAGTAVAVVLVEAVARFDAFDVPRLDEVSVDASVLAVTVGLTLLTGILFGLGPALHVGRCECGGHLAGEARAASAGRERRRMQATLSAAQIAIALVLLVGAGLMVRTLAGLTRVDPGFDSAGVLAVDLSLSDARYPTDADAIRFYRRVVDGTSALPGVVSAALVSDPPLTGGAGYWSIGLGIVGRPPKRPGEGEFAYLRWVTPQYFRTLRVPLVSGRMLDEQDVDGRPRAVVINEAFAARHFRNQDPIGERLLISWRDRTPWQIVGVVADIRQTSLTDAAEPQMYLPIYQAMSGYGTLLVRTAEEPLALVPAVRDAIRRIDSEQPIYNIRTLDDAVAASVAPQRLITQTLAAFAGAALALALIGIYGVLAFQIAERTREIGVRMALGAHAAHVVRMVIGQGMAPTLAGLAAGGAGAIVLSRLLEAWLFGVKSGDPVTYAATGVLLCTAALLACYLPARRATRIDPSIALRHE